MSDLCIIGAGPAGLACAISASEAGLSYLVLEKGCVVDSLYRFPEQMVFFSTPELLEVAGVPLTCPERKPNRLDVVTYYRKLAQRFALQIHQYRRVTKVDRTPEGFAVAAATAAGGEQTFTARNVVFATGFFDGPRRLGVPGEDLPHVSHYFRDGHPYFALPTAVVGGGNSAVETALELHRHGSAVTLIHRTSRLRSGVKYWIKPEMENRISRGEIQALFSAQVARIEPDHVLLNGDGPSDRVPAAAVFIQIGYQPPMQLMRGLGIGLRQGTNEPLLDDQLMSTVRGAYVAGSLASGNDTSRIFIENSRHHGPRIVQAIQKTLGC